MTYYLPKTSLVLTGTRTVACDDKGLFWVSSITPTTQVGPDPQTSYPLHFKPRHSRMVNNDLKVELTDDGRLKGINQSAAGQGEEIVKAAAQIAGSMIGLPPLPHVSPFNLMLERTKSKPKPKPLTPAQLACETIKSHGKDGMLTMTYVGKYEFGGADKSLIPLQMSAPKWEESINALLPQFCERQVATRTPPDTVALGSDLRNTEDYVHLRQPATVDLAVAEARDCATMADARPVWAGTILVPQLGHPYAVPIPKGQPFGKQTFAMALTDTGAITLLEYGRESGTPALLGAINDYSAASNTTEKQTKELNAQSDLIAAQQRNLRCRMDETDCK